MFPMYLFCAWWITITNASSIPQTSPAISSWLTSFSPLFLLWCTQLSHVPSAVSAWPSCLSKDLHILRRVCSCSLAGWGQAQRVLQGLSPPLHSSNTDACSPHCCYKTSVTGSRLLPFRLVWNWLVECKGIWGDWKWIGQHKANFMDQPDQDVI